MDDKLLLEEEEKQPDIENQQILNFQNRMNKRTEQIGTVTQSIGRIKDIF